MTGHRLLNWWVATLCVLANYPIELFLNTIKEKSDSDLYVKVGCLEYLSR